jgi:hypothetical protein
LHFRSLFFECVVFVLVSLKVSYLDYPYWPLTQSNAAKIKNE